MELGSKALLLAFPPWGFYSTFLAASLCTHSCTHYLPPAHSLLLSSSSSDHARVAELTIMPTFGGPYRILFLVFGQICGPSVLITGSHTKTMTFLFLPSILFLSSRKNSNSISWKEFTQRFMLHALFYHISAKKRVPLHHKLLSIITLILQTWFLIRGGVRIG